MNKTGYLVAVLILIPSLSLIWAGQIIGQLDKMVKFDETQCTTMQYVKAEPEQGLYTVTTCVKEDMTAQLQ